MHASAQTPSITIAYPASIAISPTVRPRGWIPANCSVPLDSDWRHGDEDGSRDYADADLDTVDA
jgi:hypothetical protein